MVWVTVARDDGVGILGAEVFASVSPLDTSGTPVTRVVLGRGVGMRRLAAHGQGCPCYGSGVCSVGERAVVILLGCGPAFAAVKVSVWAMGRWDRCCGIGHGRDARDTGCAGEGFGVRGSLHMGRDAHATGG